MDRIFLAVIVSGLLLTVAAASLLYKDDQSASLLRHPPGIGASNAVDQGIITRHRVSDLTNAPLETAIPRRDFDPMRAGRECGPAFDHENRKTPISKPIANAQSPNVQAETTRARLRRSPSPCGIS